MTYAENLLDRFRHVDALAQHGVAGEKVSAFNVLQSLEVKYPGIRRQAFPPSAAPTNDAPDLGPYSAAGGNFGAGTKPRWDWRSTVQDVAGWAHRMAEEVAAARQMEALAATLTEIHSKNLSTKFQIAVKFDSEELGFHLSQMDVRQRAEFVEKVTNLFRTELSFALDPENGAG